MRKVIYLLMGSFASVLIIYFLGIQVANIYVNKVFDVSWDWRLLFFDGEYTWFMFLNFLILCVVTDIVLSLFFNRKERARYKAKRRMTKEEKESHSRLAKKREAKKDLLRLDFDTHLKVTWRDQLADCFEPAVKAWNSVIKTIGICDALLLKERKTWEIGGEKVKKRGGLPIVTKRNHIYVDATDSHTLWIGTTRSGKSYGQILALLESLRMSNESCVINDPKGELYDYTADHFRADGYDVKVLNFIDPVHSDGWNPLSISYKAYDAEKKRFNLEHREWEMKKESIKNSEELAKHLLNEPEPDYSYAIELLRDVCTILTYEANVKDPYWNDTARDMAIGAGAFMLEEGIEEYMNFTSIMNFIELGERKVTVNKKSIPLLNEYMKKYRSIDNDSYHNLSGFMSAESSNRASLLSVFKNKFSIMTLSEQIKRMTSTSTFDIKDIGRKKTVVYLIVHDEKSTYYPLITLFIKQMYELLIKTSREEENSRLPVPVNIILDEMGNGAPIKGLQNILTAATSRGIRVYMALQDLEQLNTLYGTSIMEVVKSNAMNIVYLLSGSEKTRKEISSMCGTKYVWNKDKAVYEDKPVLTTDQLKSLKLGEMVFIRQRHKNAYLAKLIPYDRYKFYTKQKSKAHEAIKLPSPKYFNIWEEYQAYENGDLGQIFDMEEDMTYEQFTSSVI